MKTFAPELSALMIILRSTGPVISTRRSCRSAGVGAIVQSLWRMLAVSGKKSGRSPASNLAWRSARACSKASRRPPNVRDSSATNPRASGVSISAKAGVMGPVISTPSRERWRSADVAIACFFLPAEASETREDTGARPLRYHYNQFGECCRGLSVELGQFR